MRKSNQKFSKIARKVLFEYRKKYGYPNQRIISWGDPQLMEDLFEAFGGDRIKVREQSGCIGCSPRFKFVMDKLDYESKASNAMFAKGFISYSGIINRPTRCFELKEEYNV